MPNHPPFHRQCVLSTSCRDVALAQFSVLCSGQQDCLVISHSEQRLTAQTGLQQINFNGLHRQLGNSYDAIFLDLSEGLHLSALTILAGTLRGGGLLVLHLGEQWPVQSDKELNRFLPWPLDSSQVTSTYKTLFWKALQGPLSPFREHWPNTILPFYPKPRGLTQAQQSFVQNVLLHLTGTHMLLAPRGRGKSYALAELLHQARRQGLSCACTASSPFNLSTLEQHFQELTQHNAPFLAPDALLQSPHYYDVLVVDEAASLPLPMLDAMLEKARCIVFCSTDYGYEGSGRGFGIRFRQQLKASQQPYQEHHLVEPLRWGENDPLELWLEQLLFQDYSPALELPQRPTHLTGQQWLLHPQLLDQAFALLVNAHYQTTPENKRWLVDDPSVTTFFQYKDNRLIGVALVTEEGMLPDDLAEQVLQGRRRPRGHLLPQSLLAHEGISEAGQYRYWRVSRIAIAPQHQRQGLGSQLINQIEQQTKAKGVDFLCTSFAASNEVVKFWQRNHFTSVRLGTGQDQASGSYSLMMVKAFTKQNEQLAAQWSQGFAENWLLTLPLKLRDLPTSLIIQISQTLVMGENPHISELATKDVSDLTCFCEHHRPFDAIRAPLLRLALHQLRHHSFQEDRLDDLILLGCALNITTASDAQSLGFSGQKAFYQHLKHLIAQALQPLK